MKIVALTPEAMTITRVVFNSVDVTNRALAVDEATGEAWLYDVTADGVLIDGSARRYVGELRVDRISSRKGHP